ncbi:nucleoside-diphosphate-sugar epimerase [Arthrobacter pigmenti]|uniref:Nucleoside-diphosphate-sugar epimerase n=1 Tax=Arthrobacter pigmenti TaxID=271432 RepID=A0A846REP2_9MICC|nr:NAD-dependent epimerase/dehydratase family protein [Arthrobacter pigmenti]NJC21608.1 nucleoside-diphosphate-sugar epimerase [Arthrobacter pigmenti]
MTILIAGCGDLGTQAGLTFAASGHRVVGWRRSPEKLPLGIEGAAVDLTRPLPALPEATDVVVIALTAGGRTEAAYRSTYYDGTVNLLNAFERDGVKPRRIIFVSSTAVYGNDDGARIDESTLPSPATPTGKILRETETMLIDQAPQTVLLRLSGIYGPGRTRLIDQVRSGAAPKSAPHWTNRIHRDDAAAAIVHLAGLELPAPAYLGSDCEPAVLTDVHSFLADELRLPFGHDGAAPQPATGKRCDSSLLHRSGFEFTYPTYREGYRAVLSGVGTRHP